MKRGNKFERKQERVFGGRKGKSKTITIISKKIFLKETNNNNKNNNTECCGSCLRSQHLGGRGGKKRLEASLKYMRPCWGRGAKTKQKQ